MRLVLHRAAAARALLLTAALVATVTVVVLTTFLQYAHLLPAAGVRAAVATAPAVDRALVASGGSGSTPAEVASRDRAMRDLFGAGLGGLPVDVTMGGYASGQRLDDPLGSNAPDAPRRYAVVAFLDALPEHAQLAAGVWPRPVPPGHPAQVALPEQVAAELNVAVGDPVPITDEHARASRPVQVVGIFRPRDPAEPYWELAAAPVRGGGIGPLVVHRDEFLARYLTLSTLDWVVVPALVDATGAELSRLAAAAGTLRGQAPEDLGLDRSIRFRTGLPELAAALATANTVTRSGLLLPALLFAVIAGFGLLLIARLLAEHRRDENALLRARGAAPGQLARLAAGEALLVAAPAALLGPPLAAHLLRLVDDRLARDGLPLLAGPAPLGPQTAIGPLGTATAWIIAAVAALGCATALVVPAWRRRATWVAEQQERARPSRTAWAVRAGADLALVVVALVAGIQLRRYAGALTPTAADVRSLGIDPLLVAAPTLGVLAATVLALRVQPLVTRAAVRMAGRGDSFSRLLGLWQADRRPHAGPVLLLVLTVAAGTLAVCVAGTWQRSQRDQATHRVGADLRVSRPFGDSAPLPDDVARLPGVAAAMAVHRGQVKVGQEGEVTLLAVDATAPGAVVRLRPDLADDTPQRLFDALVRERRRLSGVMLPPSARRLAGEVRVVGTDAQWGPARALNLVAYLDDGTGGVRTVPLGTPEGGRLVFDVPLPAPPAGGHRLLGFSGEALTSSRSPYDLQSPPPIGRIDQLVEWRWSQLSTVDDSGARTAVTVPREWAVGMVPGTAFQHTHIVRTSTGFTIVVELSARFVFADLSRPQPVPALVTPHVLKAAAATVGDTLDLDGSVSEPGLQIRVVGVLESMPGTRDGAGVAVDLPTLAAYRMAAGQPTVTAGEWWLATNGRREALAAAADRGLAVTDLAAETRRLLDDPLGVGVLLALYATVLVGTVIAAFGLVVDARATALRRSGELAVLHTLGASPVTLARALVVEQSVLAGLGVLGGLLVGLAVAATLATSLVPTASGARPVPEPLLTVPAPVALPAVALFAVALVLSAAAARRARRDVVAGLLRIGGDR